MNMAGTLQGSSAAAEGGVDIKFSHIQLYTDRVCAVSYADKSGKYQDQRGLTLPMVD